MEAEYFYCSSCGYEDFDITVAYRRTTANSDWYDCPLCGEESLNVEVAEQ